MPCKINELVQVKLRVQHSLNEYPGRSRDYFIAVTGPGIQLGNEDPKIAPRCRLIRQNTWEKELWLPKECRIDYKFLVVHSFTGTVKDIESVVSRQLNVGQFPVTMEHVYNASGERKIVETNRKVNRYQNKNGSNNNFLKPDHKTRESINKSVTQDVKTDSSTIHKEEESNADKKVLEATNPKPKQEVVDTQVNGSQSFDNASTQSTEPDSDKTYIQSVTTVPEGECNQALQTEDTTKVDVLSTTDNEVNQLIQTKSDDTVDNTLDSNEMGDTLVITTIESVITTTDIVTVANAVSDKKGSNCGRIFGRKGVVVAISCIAVAAGLGYVAFFRK